MTYPSCSLSDHSRSAHYAEGGPCFGSPNCPCQVWDPGVEWLGHIFRESGG